MKKFFELSNHLSNVLVTVSDKLLGKPVSDPSLSDYYMAQVKTASDYYPFGWQMPGKKIDSGDYRFGFNGVEKVPEMGEGHNTTFYREQDTRIARWWTFDPKPNASVSPYAMMEGNPISFGDPLGDTTWVYNTVGTLLRRIDDKLPNGQYFIKEMTKSIELNIDEICTPEGQGKYTRGISQFYIGPNTISDMLEIRIRADGVDGKEGEGLEVYFAIFYLDPIIHAGKNLSKELRLIDVSDDPSIIKERHPSSTELKDGYMPFITVLEKYYGFSDDRLSRRAFVGLGHYHAKASALDEGADIVDLIYPTNMGKNGMHDVDFRDYLFGTGNFTTQSLPIVVSPIGYTIHSQTINTPDHMKHDHKWPGYTSNMGQTFMFNQGFYKDLNDKNE